MYYLRKRVPTRFAGVAGVPSGIVKRSLETKDPREAKRRWPGALDKWAAEEAEWERRANAIPVTREIAEKIAAAWVAAVAAGRLKVALNTADSRALALSFPDRRVRRREGQEGPSAEDESEATATAAEARTREIVALHTAEALSIAKIAIADETSPMLYGVMLRAVRAAYSQLKSDVVHAATRPLDILQGRLPPSESPLSTSPTLSLRGLFKAWKAVATVTTRTMREAEYAVEALVQHLGHDDAGRLSKADLIGWRDALKAAGSSNNTWNNRHSLISQVLKRAEADGLIPFNPADRLRLPKAKPESPQPYSDGQAALILNAARKQRPGKTHWAERRWAHWIMAFTGMRVGEVLQLYVADLKHDGNVAYFDVTDARPGQSVKNSQPRHVPIHPALITEGLLKYAASVPQDGQLFPDKKPDKAGNLGGDAWKVVGRWVRDGVGITADDISPDHSWRHRVEDELRAAGIDEPLRDAILGHARKTIGRQYGIRGESLQKLADAVSRIPVPLGIELACTTPDRAAE